MQTAYIWTLFTDRGAGTIQAFYNPATPQEIPEINARHDENTKRMLEAASAVAAESGTVREQHQIPYPSSPKIGDIDCPDFCYRGRECFGKTACPGNPSCTS